MRDPRRWEGAQRSRPAGAGLGDGKATVTQGGTRAVPGTACRLEGKTALTELTGICVK